ncbi:MAG: hypothetical protein AVDCRST_MAG25-1175 [uncultured Rubrobacteraceae bacterium]|uniref:Uncharacterized protein n=1 Tax=uncultured Rubrobacteraceae bacterium TaxID=349277 RepID=A0A6J4R3U5_9ACTN|nr:MAG: hypothetical protein AVDCRST_MAG25-1175 [uncultured Rubrobacteraceae bacterium]
MLAAPLLRWAGVAAMRETSVYTPLANRARGAAHSITASGKP